MGRSHERSTVQSPGSPSDPDAPPDEVRSGRWERADRCAAALRRISFPFRTRDPGRTASPAKEAASVDERHELSDARLVVRVLPTERPSQFDLLATNQGQDEHQVHPERAKKDPRRHEKRNPEGAK